MKSESNDDVLQHVSKDSITSIDSFVVINTPKPSDTEQIREHEAAIVRSSLIRGPDWPETIPSLWEEFIKRSHDRADDLAIASIDQKGTLLGLQNTPSHHPAYESAPYVRWSYREVARGVALLANALAKRDIREGSTIVIFANNCAEVPLILWASTFLGCDYVPLHPRSLLNKAEAGHVLSTVVKSGAQQKIIIFAQDAETARKVQQLNMTDVKDFVVIEEDNTDTEFLSLVRLMEAEQNSEPVTLDQYLDSSTKCGIIIFTSGTTALPKGVRANASQINRWVVVRQSSQHVGPQHSCFFMLPTNHLYYFLIELVFRTAGAATVLPGSGFTPQTMPDLITVEKCTHFPTSPSMVYGLSQVAIDRNFRFDTVESMSCGGSNLGTDVVSNILDVIGSQTIEVIYGQTEMSVVSSTGNVSEYSQVVNNGLVFVGKPVYGATVKVCAQSSTEALPVNEEGEIHVSTLCLCDGYVGGDVPSTFYVDKAGMRWLITGDAGFINEDGMIFVSGRVKDMIIRGGVNISPAAIELLLANGPQTARLMTQIVSRKDKIAGEVPIAVVKGPITKQEVDNLQDYVLRNMGSIYVPEEVLTLEDLGLEAFPSTILGKVKKATLRQFIDSLSDGPKHPELELEKPVDGVTLKVQASWSRILGHQVDLDTPITTFADSIHLMRARDRFAKDIGVNLTLAEILKASTVREQIEMVRTRIEHGPTNSQIVVPQAQQPDNEHVLSHFDIVHLRAHPGRFQRARTYIEKRIGTCGLDWADVQAITPASDMTSVLTQADILNTSWSWKLALLAKTGMTKSGLRVAIEAFMRNHPLLASMYMWNRPAFETDDAVHVIFHHTQKLFDKVIHDYGGLATRKDLEAEVFKPYEYQMSLISGLLTNFLLFDIEDTGRCGVIIVFHHVHIDGSYLPKMLEDLDQAVAGEELKPHVSYKTWADSYYALRSTPLALEQVSWHVDRLSDLVSQRESVFPQLPRPHHYTSQTLHVQNVDDNGYHFDFRAAGLTNLRQKHSHLSAPTVIKAAWILLNLHRNKTSTAVFSQLHADRQQFPFVPQALIDIVPPESYSATDVAGNTLQDVVSITNLVPKETVLDFMNRVKLDQEENNSRAAAPLRHIFAGIGTANAEIMLDIFRSQIFNWTPGLSAFQMHNPYENIEPVSSFIRPAQRLVINVDVGGANHETVFAQIKSPLFDKVSLRKLGREFEDFVLWICDEKNWSSRTGSFREALRPETDDHLEENIKESHHII